MFSLEEFIVKKQVSAGQGESADVVQLLDYYWRQWKVRAA